VAVRASGAVARTVLDPRAMSRPLIGTSPALLAAIETLCRVAPTDVTVLVLGETGTGKELAARLVHDRSRRAGAPFVAVNCAALPPALVESELFGHEAGAFTGAIRRRIGRLELAAGGTLFLDEIGDLPADAQAKLLRALQEHAIERVGGAESIAVDVRLVAATNRELAADVERGGFRRDLYYRLAVVGVRLPPLRERPGDVAPLAAYFVARAAERLGVAGVVLGAAAIARLETYAWPGNVRELENVALRVVALAAPGAVIEPEQLGLVDDAPAHAVVPAADLHALLAYCEREIIRRALYHHGGNRTRAAVALGISRQALQQRLARLIG
jgi:transcriptional regulator with PAS, ATPase and Fis domain